MSQEKKYDVFISYSRKDYDEVKAFVDMLKERIPTLKVWMDLEGITAADEFDEKIITAIDASSYVIFAMSPNSNSVGENSSKWTKKELVYAKNTGKKVIPILLKDASLNSWFLFEFGRTDCIDSSNKYQTEKLLKNIARWTNKKLVKTNKEVETKSLTENERQIFYEAQAFKTRVEKQKRIASVVLNSIGIAILLITLIVIGVNRYKIHKGIHWEYTILNDSIAPYTIEISGFEFVDEYQSSKISIPKKIKRNNTTYLVTNIGEYAFMDCSGLTSITIPNSVTSIGKDAFFGCSALPSITIPNSVTSIGEGAFYDCSGLTSITIPNSVTSIGKNAFYSCSALTSITIPNSVTSIGDCAFDYCSGLTSITIPNSVTSIGWSAFSGCSSLTSITIPNSVTSIGWSAFSGCSSLASITIPNSVTSIGWSAFSGCSSLTSITIPNSVTSIGDGAFVDCSNLTSIVVEKGNKMYDSRENCNAIIETASNTLICGCKNTTIPNSVTSIGEKAFSGCSGLTSITIPNSVTSIGWSAFSGCSSLASITIPNSITRIEFMTFYLCSGLTSITIPNSVKSIGDEAFRGCSDLKSVKIPKTLTEIGTGALPKNIKVVPY